ncbi:MAG: TIGR01777 family oxidoreductase [Cyanobacteria bacterium]|nr:TIGR01777 family oxidoreductase [Cyanobacteriota bacterium]
MKQTFHFSTAMPASAEEVCLWHTQYGAFERLIPPWERVDVVSQTGNIVDGGILKMKVYLGPFPILWVAKMFGYVPGVQFQDVQLQGPNHAWLHTHKFIPQDDTHSILEEVIEYELPMGFLGYLFGRPFFEEKLRRMFIYRHRTTHQDLQLHQTYQEHCQGVSSMNIAVSGSTGLVGSALKAFLTTGGHQVTPIVRTLSEGGKPGILWNYETNQIDAAAFEGLDAVVHLAGDNIAEGRWSDDKKKAIRDSRVKGTRLLCEALAKLENPPKVLICASAIGIYGSRGDEVLNEESKPAKDFLADVCVEWEAATEVASKAGIRVVNIRIGVILSPKGGALAKMLPPFLLGAGGNLGDGQQYMSWVSLDDVVGAIYHALQTDSLKGPVNVVSPNACRNSEFTKVLGHAIHRPTLAPAPAFALRLLLGEMADALLLSSTRVEPAQLKKSGYQFLYPKLSDALDHCFGHQPALSH